MELFVHAIGGSIFLRCFLLRIDHKTTSAILSAKVLELKCGCRRLETDPQFVITKAKRKSAFWRCPNGHVIGVCAKTPEKLKKILDYITGGYENESN